MSLGATLSDEFTSTWNTYVSHSYGTETVERVREFIGGIPKVRSRPIPVNRIRRSINSKNQNHPGVGLRGQRLVGQCKQGTIDRVFVM